MATSTPISGVKSQAFLGLFTRAITRGTPNSKRAMVVMTRLASSSPVTAANTWASPIPAASRTVGDDPHLGLADPGRFEDRRGRSIAFQHDLRRELVPQPL